MGKSQADRKAAKKSTQVVEDDEPVQGASASKLADTAKTLVKGSIISQYGLLLPTIVKDGVEEAKKISKGGSPKKSSETKPPEEGKVSDVTETDEAEKEAPVEGTAEAPAKEEVTEVTKDPAAIYKILQERLTPVSPLGLSEKMSKEVLLSLKEKEFDGGPRAKRNSSPGKERILVNLNTNMLAYIHILLGLMVLRAFFLRSWFASLPWLVGYQYLSLVIPLDSSEKASGPLAKIPIPWEKVPLEKCPVELRVGLSFAIHALIWLFFVYEVVLCTNWFEKIPIAGLFAYHAYAFRTEA